MGLRQNLGKAVSGIPQGAAPVLLRISSAGGASRERKRPLGTVLMVAGVRYSRRSRGPQCGFPLEQSLALKASQTLAVQLATPRGYGLWLR
jgi:hypothetical protein